MLRILSRSVIACFFIIVILGISSVSGKTIRVGFTDWTPFSYLDDSGTPRGLDIELISEILSHFEKKSLCHSSLFHSIRYKLIIEETVRKLSRVCKRSQPEAYPLDTYFNNS